MARRKVLSRHRPLLLLGALLLLLSGLQPLLWLGVQRAAETLQQKRSQEQQILTLQQRISAAAAASTASSALREQAAVAVPAATAIPQIVDRLERLAGERGVSVSFTEIKERELRVSRRTTSPVQPVSVFIHARGEAAALLGYLDGLEHLPELTAVEEWQLTPDAFVPLNPASAGNPAPNTYLLTASVIFFLESTADADTGE